ncbi:MAG: MotA/TolQ/ExbB proton channel family protein [Planctomyces sp.]|nr:MotA/TolQ/ExbB proton channel family protein [Planctomyces sp.]
MSHTDQNAVLDRPEISWYRSDVEQMLYFSGGRFTRVNTLLSFLSGLLIGSVFYGLLLLGPDSIRTKFVDQGWIPYATVMLAAWSVAILFYKWLKLRMQRRCLQLQVVPEHPEFVLSPQSVDQVIDQIGRLVDDPRQFVLMNRICIALANLKNLGRVTDVDEILRSQAESDEAISESSYILLTGFLWAIPILGFIGTVLGLSIAIGEFGTVMAGGDAGADALLPALRQVTGGLAIAFDTTLVALVFALIIQLAMTFLKKSEQEFLDNCAEYCSRNIVNRLRLLPFEEPTILAS